MKTKTATILLIVFIALVAVYVAFEKPFSNPYERSSAKTGKIYGSLKVQDIEKIEIRSKDNAATLMKSGSGWQVFEMDKFPADAQNVDAIINTALEMEYTEPVSENPDKRSLYEVDEESGVRIRLFAAGDRLLADFIVGQQSAEPGAAYVRLADSNEVMTQKGLKKYQADKSPADWRNRILLKFDIADITEITIERPAIPEQGEKAQEGAREKIVAAFDDGGNWTVLEPVEKPGKKTELDRVARLMATLRAMNIPDQNIENTGLDNPEYTATFKFKDGSSQQLLIGTHTEDDLNQFYATSAGSSYLYTLGKNQFSALEKRVSEITEEPPAEPEATEPETPAQ
ncbi:MAG TPA: DUF4340 domain-containing protein [bacterium]|nr:DUF4340 domain-containing protein [bacterium]